jgi:hypothetical protein
MPFKTHEKKKSLSSLWRKINILLKFELLLNDSDFSDNLIKYIVYLSIRRSDLKPQAATIPVIESISSAWVTGQSKLQSLQGQMLNAFQAVIHGPQILESKKRQELLFKITTIGGGVALMCMEAGPIAMVAAGIMLIEPVSQTAHLIHEGARLYFETRANVSSAGATDASIQDAKDNLNKLVPSIF